MRQDHENAEGRRPCAGLGTTYFVGDVAESWKRLVGGFPTLTAWLSRARGNKMGAVGAISCACQGEKTVHTDRGHAIAPNRCQSAHQGLPGTAFGKTIR